MPAKEGKSRDQDTANALSGLYFSLISGLPVRSEAIGSPFLGLLAPCR